MTDIHQSYNPQNRPSTGTPSHHQHNHHVSPRVHQAVKAATAATAGGSLLVLSCLVLVLTVISLTIATPLLAIFSPVLVPAAITLFLLVTGFLTSGGFGVAAVAVLSWIYKYATGGHPPGAGSLDQARDRLGYKAREMKDATGMWQREAGGAAHHRALA